MTRVIRNKFPAFIPDLIICSDLHMMEKERNPPCRLDSHWDAQFNKTRQIADLQRKFDCPVYCAGDVFEWWKASPELINACMANFPEDLHSIAGQHDLPQHNMDLLNKSAFETLCRAGTIEFMFGQGNWGRTPKQMGYTIRKGRMIAVAHMLVYKGEMPFPDCTAPEVKKVFKMFPEADLIITGDNHMTFTARHKNQLLINPGSLTRHKADQIDHKPCVFLWQARTNTFKIHYLKIKKKVISRDHIDIANAKKERGEAFIQKLNNEWTVEVSFEDNLDQAIQINKIKPEIESHITRWMEAANER